jgi:hypothetical protein
MYDSPVFTKVGLVRTRKHRLLTSSFAMHMITIILTLVGMAIEYLKQAQMYEAAIDVYVLESFSIEFQILR